MGFYFRGRLYDWGNPIALLRFPGSDLVSKLPLRPARLRHRRACRTGAQLDKVPCTDWLKKWVGERGYDVLWRSLFELKFFEYKDSLSAAWLGTRIKRVALSRKRHLPGEARLPRGRLRHAARCDRGAHPRARRADLLKSGAEKIESAGGRRARHPRGRRAQALRHRGLDDSRFPYLVKLAPTFPRDERAKVAAIVNIGVVCAGVQAQAPRHATTSGPTSTTPDIRIPGLIEYSNLNPLPCTIVYAPFYMPVTNAKYKDPPQAFIDEVKGYIKRLNPQFDESWVLAARAFRYEFAQTVCTPNFYAALPPMKSEGVRPLPRRHLALLSGRPLDLGEHAARANARGARRRAAMTRRVPPIPGGGRHRRGRQRALEDRLQHFMGLEAAVVLAYCVGKLGRLRADALAGIPAVRGAGSRARWRSSSGVNLAAVGADAGDHAAPRALGASRRSACSGFVEEIAHVAGVCVPVVTSYFGHKHFSFRRGLSVAQAASDPERLRRLVRVVVLGAMAWSLAIAAAAVLWGGEAFRARLGRRRTGARRGDRCCLLREPPAALPALAAHAALRGPLRALAAEPSRFPRRGLRAPADAGEGGRRGAKLPPPRRRRPGAREPRRVLSSSGCSTLVGLVVIASLLFLRGAPATQARAGARHRHGRHCRRRSRPAHLPAPAAAARGAPARRARRGLAGEFFADAGHMLSAWRLPAFVAIGLLANLVTARCSGMRYSRRPPLPFTTAAGVLGISHLSGSASLLPAAWAASRWRCSASLRCSRFPPRRRSSRCALVRLVTLWGSVAVGTAPALLGPAARLEPASPHRLDDLRGRRLGREPRRVDRHLGGPGRS
jgi:hypothetical protein